MEQEYTDEDLLDTLERWEKTGLLVNLPPHEKQELAVIFDNATRIFLSKKLSDEIYDIVESTLFPICRRLYRRIGSSFDIEKMVSDLIQKIKENKNFFKTKDPNTKVNPIVSFSVNFADIYEDDVINIKQFNDEEYVERVDKLLKIMRQILLNKNLVSFVDRTDGNWKIAESETKKSEKETRYRNQKIAKEIFENIIKDTNKGI